MRERGAVPLDLALKHFVFLLVIADKVRCNQNSLAYRVSAWVFPVAFTAAIPSACRWRIDSRSVCAKLAMT